MKILNLVTFTSYAVFYQMRYIMQKSLISMNLIDGKLEQNPQ